MADEVRELLDAYGPQASALLGRLRPLEGGLSSKQLIVAAEALRDAAGPLLLRAARAGFAASGEGFNGECAYDHLARTEAEVLRCFELAGQDPAVMEQLQKALRAVNLLPPAGIPDVR
jgi:hypothetical protein